MNNAVKNSVIPREDAVRAISDAIKDQTAFVITTPPALLGDVVERLRMINGWTCLVDNGAPMVLAAVNVDLVKVTCAVGPAAGVILVPKIVAAARLGRALGQEIPKDGSQDMVLLTDPRTGQYAWPMLFVDALDEVDPVYAAKIRALEVDAS